MFRAKIGCCIEWWWENYWLSKRFFEKNRYLHKIPPIFCSTFHFNVRKFHEFLSLFLHNHCFCLKMWKLTQHFENMWKNERLNISTKHCRRNDLGSWNLDVDSRLNVFSQHFLRWAWLCRPLYLFRSVVIKNLWFSACMPSNDQDEFRYRYYFIDIFDFARTWGPVYAWITLLNAPMT